LKRSRQALEFFRDAKIVLGKFVDKFFHRDILLEATSSQQICENMVCSGDQGSDQGSNQLSASVTELEMKLKFFKLVIKIILIML